MAGGATISNPAFLNGGPMMGVLFHDLDEPIKKTTGALLVLPDDHLLIRRRTQDMASVVAMARTVCEQCCLCTELCPRHLIGHELPPHLIVRAVNYQKADQTECSTILSALTCSECGICEAYACPVEISPMRLNQALKAQFRAEGAKYVGELRPLNQMAGGATISNPAFLNGGPMMGVLFHDLDEPIKKTTGALLVLPDDHLLIRRRTQDMASVVAMARTVCEQCCLCTELCPRHLIGHELPPHLIVRAVNYQKADQTECSTILSALTCSECGICEAYACPVEISPMRLNQALKAQFRAEGAKYVGELRPLNPMAEYRLLPISRLITRIDLDRMNHKAPMIDLEWMPSKVVLPLLQHIGAPAKPVVAVGDRVTRGQLIASMETGKLGVPLHASISGIIQNIDDHKIVIVQE